MTGDDLSIDLGRWIGNDLRRWHGGTRLAWERMDTTCGSILGRLGFLAPLTCLLSNMGTGFWVQSLACLQSGW